MRFLPIMVISLTALAAHAEPLGISSQAPEPSVTVGARIGGYGFRRDSDTSFTGDWNECRMNGVGVFAQRTIHGPFFVEAGLDTYFSTTDRASGDLPIDRENILISTAAGMRTNFMPWLEGYAQIGFGVELDKLKVPYGDDAIRGDKVMPEGFIGIGGNIKIGESTRLGATVRTLVMGNFNYDPQRLDMSNQAWTSTPTADQVFSATPTLAAQMQFFLSHDM